jgi:2-hydroxychromene-2-carboxylate isomerase
MRDIEFFFDVGSPYSYLAFHALPAIAERNGVAVIYRPFLLGAVFKATGNSPPAMVPARGRWMFADLQRWGEKYGLPFVLPTTFPINTLLPMRALTAVGPERIRDAANSLFHAYWGEGLDISEPDLIDQLLGTRVTSEASTEAVKLHLREVTNEAVERGAFGAPTFFIGDELIFGNDRLDFLEELLRRS